MVDEKKENLVKNAVDTAKSAMGNAADAVTRAGEDAVGAVAKVGSDAINATAKTAEIAKEGIGGLADGARNAISDATGRMSHATSEIFTNVRKGVNPERPLTEDEAREQLENNIPAALALLEDRYQLEAHLVRIEEKLKQVPQVGEQLSYAPILVMMVWSWLRKEYTEPPIGTIAAIVAALIYFLAPVDLIPDVIPGVGYMDDVAVFAACMALVSADVENYQAWRKEKFGLIAGDSADEV